MDRIKYLLLLVLREEASPAEQAELEAWAHSDPANRELMQELQDPALVAEALAVLDGLHRRKPGSRWSNYAASHRTAAVVPINGRDAGNIRLDAAAKTFFRCSGAAAVVIRNRKPQAPMAAAKPADTSANRSRATLTLGNGQQIILTFRRRVVRSVQQGNGAEGGRQRGRGKLS